MNCLRTKPLAQHDAWLSFYLQLYPEMSWGLVTICMPPKKFDVKIQGVYERALPFLGVNCKIRWEWRTLPETYQGLGMPNMPLISLLEKISFLLGNWGFLGQAHSNTLLMAYEKNLSKLAYTVLHCKEVTMTLDTCVRMPLGSRTYGYWFQSMRFGQKIWYRRG